MARVHIGGLCRALVTVASSEWVVSANGSCCCSGCGGVNRRCQYQFIRNRLSNVKIRGANASVGLWFLTGRTRSERRKECSEERIGTGLVCAKFAMKWKFVRR